MDNGAGARSDLHLVRLSGPEVKAIRLAPGEEPVVLGRGSTSAIRLDHKAVSRRHAILEYHAGRWHIRDAGSRHGTAVNGVPLAPGVFTPLTDGDRVRVLPWNFLVRIGPGSRESFRPVADERVDDTVQTVLHSPTRSATPDELDILLKSTSALHAADREDTYATALLEGLTACGFERAAVLMRSGSDEEVEILGARDLASGRETGFSFSRTLLRTALGGQLAQVLRGDSSGGSTDFTRSGITDGVCAPIWLDEAVWGFLYADTQRNHASIETAIPLVRSLSQIASDALARLKREELRGRLQSLHAELSLAAEAQSLLMPSGTGETEAVVYAARSVHGRAVSGDLLDIISVSPGRTAVVLGDVVGKGAGAGVIMVLAQSFLHARLTAGESVGASMEALNRHLCMRLRSGQFVSLWAGVFDASAHSLEFVDAGHGYAATVGAGVASERLARQGSGGLLLGIQDYERYPSRRVDLDPGRRVLVFSDGLVEQPSSEGEPFGFERLVGATEGSVSAAEDVERVFAAVEEHADGQSLTDDATLVSVALLGSG